MNKGLIAAKLERLNVFLEEKIDETDKSIVYWEGKIEKFGTAACKDCLNTAIENKKYFENEIKENEALIKELREEVQNEN